jgi:deazaflavin-dependent oxidoreductase (nitroreductase family)
MMAQAASHSRVPFFVPIFNPLATRLLRRGRLMGPNALLTVRGRKSGLMRSTPVALVERQGRRWIIGTFGDVNWVRNLRASGEATITIGKRRDAITARELSLDETAAFFRGVLTPYVTSIPIGRLLIRMLGAGDIIDDPMAAARHRPVFELTA